jgi:hypothetical protein
MKIILLFTLNIHKDGLGRDGQRDAEEAARFETYL